MSRLPVLAFTFAALSAQAFDLEKWADDLANRQMDRWKRERIQAVTQDPDPKARREAVEGLAVTDPDSVAAFAIALSDKDADVRRAAASQLWSAEKRAEPYRDRLLKALDDPDANVVAYAAGALQVIGMKEEELAPARKRVLSASEASVSARFLVARNLVGYEEPMRLVGPMVAFLERNTQAYTGSVSDRNRHNVEMVEKALERLVKVTKDRAVAKPLLEALDQTRNGHIPLLKTLGRFEPRVEGWTQVLLRQLSNPSPRVRYAALGELRSVKHEEEIGVWMPHAARMLEDPDPSVRSEALWALGAAKGLAATEIDKVAAAARDPEATVRRSAARALGEIAEGNQAIPASMKARAIAAARPALEAALQDPNEDVRREAQSALRNLERTGALAVAASAAAPSSVASSSEAGGMAVLRARNVTFEPQSFYRALSQVDPDLVRAFLDAGMSPSASVADMGPPIRVMLFSSNACAPNVRPTRAETKAIVKLLLERGADIHAADGNGNTAITEAASKGCDRELIRMLIKAGAKIHATNGSGLTPFEMGLWSGHDGLEELIAAGYRLPAEKVKMYLEGYKDRPGAISMVKKAAARK